MESLDYRYHDIHVNKHSARIAADGSCTIVLAHRDPGVANWVETASHERGTMCMRWVGASEHVDPTTQVIKHDQLEQALPGALAASRRPPSSSTNCPPTHAPPMKLSRTAQHPRFAQRPQNYMR